MRTRRWIRGLRVIRSNPRLTRSCSASCVAHPTTHWTDPTESRRTGSRLHYARTSVVHLVAMHVRRWTQWLLIRSLSGHGRVTHAWCWSTTIRLATRRTWRHLNVLLANSRGHRARTCGSCRRRGRSHPLRIWCPWASWSIRTVVTILS